MSVVVLAPHTDDAELCAGGTIAKFIEAGRDVYVYAFSCGTSNVSEFKAACRVMQVTGEAFNFHTRYFVDARQSILEKLIEIRKEIKPSIVLLPASSDQHQDHGVITQEGLRAFKHCTLYGFEAYWNSYTFENHCYATLTPDHVNRKLEALKEYESQKERFYFQEENVVSALRFRGAQVNSVYAECFQVFRQFI